MTVESRAEWSGRPRHRMLVALPIGLPMASVVFDGLPLLIAGAWMPAAASWMWASGVVGGPVAAPFGWQILMVIPADTRASRYGALHGAGDVVVVLCLFGWVANWSRGWASACRQRRTGMRAAALPGQSTPRRAA